VANSQTKTIGDFLREARREAGLSTRDVERITGMSTAAISQIENGHRRDPGFSTVLTLARALGITMEDLALRYEGQPRSSAARKRQLSAALSELARAEHEALQLAERIGRATVALGAKPKRPPTEYRKR